MDYCSSCRRHLNGALACAGCGAYAPDIAPPVQISTVTGAAAAWDDAPLWRDSGLHEEPAAGPGLADDVSDAPVVAEGRAARRRQRARWKKNQRKAVVATAVALVGGGLTVSAMNQGAGTKAQAATSPDNRAMGGVELPTSDDSLPGATSGQAEQAATATPAKKGGAHRRTADSTSTTPRTSSVHTDSVGTPTPTATTGAQSPSRSTLSTSTDAGTTGSAGTSGTTGTTTAQTPSSTATDSTTTTTTTDTGTGTSGSSGSQTSQTTPSSSATDPSGLCVLNLLCIS